VKREEDGLPSSPTVKREKGAEVGLFLFIFLLKVHIVRDRVSTNSETGRGRALGSPSRSKTFLQTGIYTRVYQEVSERHQPGVYQEVSERNQPGYTTGCITLSLTPGYTTGCITLSHTRVYLSRCITLTPGYTSVGV